MQEATGLQFYYFIADQKYIHNLFKQNTLHAIVFKLQPNN